MQIGVLIAGASLLIALLRLREPLARLGCYEATLVACLCLPLAETWKRSVLPVADLGDAAFAPVGAGRAPLGATVQHMAASFSLAERVWLLLLGGLVVRLVWIASGFWTLRRYRERSRAYPGIPLSLRNWMSRHGVAAAFAISHKVAGPVTFGLRRPLVLLPARFETLTAEVREAVLCHELTHVRRKDWAYTVVEELILALLWFHPAVWWLVSEIRLAREQVVDLEAIAVSDSRSAYLDALLDAAKSTAPERLVPAASFLWRSHLVRRVAAIVQPVAISKRRVVSSLAAMLVGTALAIRAAIVFFPLTSPLQAQTVAAQPIIVEQGGEHLLRRAALEYPRWVINKQVAGLIAAEVTVDENGLVTDAHVISGPQELRRPVLQSLLNWQFDPQAQPPGPVPIAIRFSLPSGQLKETPILPEYPAFAESRVEGESGTFSFRRDVSPSEEMKQLMENVVSAREGKLTGKVGAIRAHGAAERMDLRLPVGVGDVITPESIGRVLDSGFVIGLEKGPDGLIVVHVFGGTQPEERR